MKIDIVNIKNIHVAALEHVGNPELLGESIAAFRDWRKESGCSPVAEKRTFGVARSNPEAIPVQAFRFDICAEIDGGVPSNTYGVISKVIEGGRYARMRHQGSRDVLKEKVDGLYRTWLPASDEGKRDAPVFFEYLNISSEQDESEMLTDIFIPLKAK